MQATKTALGRAMSALLILVMLFGILSVGAGAANADNVRHYDTYVCMGDSIAAGFGDYAPKTYCYERVDVAYHALVADATGAELIPIAHVGTRTEELRWLLEDDFEGDEVCMSFNGMNAYDTWLAGRTSADEPNPGVSDAVYNMLKDYYGEGALQRFYRDQVQKADLITLEVGENDVILYAALQTMAVLYDETESPYVERMKQLMGEQESYGQALDILFQTANTVHKMSTVVQTFVEKINHGYQHFFQNWEPLIQDIQRLNPDATLVVVGLYNPMNKAKLTDNSMITIGKAVDTMVIGANAFMRQQASRLGYLYADVMGTDLLDTVPITDSAFVGRILTACHPSIEGHAFMAKQILAVLPERGTEPDPASSDPTPVDPTPADPQPVKTFPFTDVKPADWFYDDVYFVWENGIMNGMTSTTFDPKGTTTRAQFATVLYRMADSPAVSDADKAACPFTDLTADWYRDAVVWAYKNEVVNGVSATAFDPNAPITREQLVSMLYRYAGSPASSTDLSRFKDNASISAYARPAVAWAAENGIVSGMPDGTFQPKGNATRAQLAAILTRFMTL